MWLCLLRVLDGCFADREYQQRRFRLCHETLNPFALSSQQFGDYSRRLIPDIKPDDSWREAFYEASISKICVFRNDHIIKLLTEIPNLAVTGSFQSYISYMRASGIFRHEVVHKFGAQVFVKEKFHAAELDKRRSRDAAKAKQALISSRVRSGKSERIFSSSMPPARYSRMSYTVMRVPLIHGLPLRINGFTEIRSCQFITCISYHGERRISRQVSVFQNSISLNNN